MKPWKIIAAVGVLAAASLWYADRNFMFDSRQTLLARIAMGEGENCSNEERARIIFTAPNREELGGYGNGLRKIVLRGYSSVHDSNSDKVRHPTRYNKKAWQECLEVADSIQHGGYPELNQGQTHFHNKKSIPYWTKSNQMTRLETPGTTHTFYAEHRKKGKR